MKLLLIRHAQSANNRLVAEMGRDDGRIPDPDITDLGVEQAKALAQMLASGRYPTITHLYCSLMRRTIQTAVPIADTLDLQIVARTDAHEFPGPYTGPSSQRASHQGSPRSQLMAFSSRTQLPDSATEDGWYTGGLETEEALEQRAAALIEDLRAHHEPQDVVALVSHGWFGAIVLKTALGASAQAWFDHHNTATSLIEWRNFLVSGEDTPRPETVLVWGNRTDHLTPEQISS